jgi:hypothetical protein
MSIVLVGRALKLARVLCFIFLFSEYNQIIASSKFLYKFDLNSEKYEIKFVG